MATYNSKYPYRPTRRRKQRYALMERVIDFSKLPITSGQLGDSGYGTTAWALNDVLEAIPLKAGQTVLSVRVEVLTASDDTGDRIQIGYGSSPQYWGEYLLYRNAGYKVEEQFHQAPPLYFSSADTVDIKIKKAALQGKIRVIIHILEDDR